VALLSGIIWIVFAIIISLLLHADGTVSGVVASTHDGSALPAQLAGLLTQQLIFGAIGLGLGAWAGALGSNRAPLPEMTDTAVPAYVLPATYGMYPAYPPIAGYPTYGGYPVSPTPYQAPAPYAPLPQQLPQPPGNTPPSYPPPPDYYRTADAGQTSIAPQPPLSSGPENAPAADGAANQPPAE